MQRSWKLNFLNPLMVQNNSKPLRSESALRIHYNKVRVSLSISTRPKTKNQKPKTISPSNYKKYFLYE